MSAISELLEQPSDAIADRLFDEILLGGPDEYDEDPVIHVLYWQARQYLHAACASMARYLHQAYGQPVILLEARRPGEEWHLRHAAITTQAERADLRAFSDGFDVPIIDAAGGGTFGDRAALYDLHDYEFQIVYAIDSSNSANRWIAEDLTPIDLRDDVLALPGLCRELDLPFDAKTALTWILEKAADDRTVDHDVIEACRYLISEPTVSL